jgi:hypothetical protein
MPTFAVLDAGSGRAPPTSVLGLQQHQQGGQAAAAAGAGSGAPGWQVLQDSFTGLTGKGSAGHMLVASREFDARVAIQ